MELETEMDSNFGAEILALSKAVGDECRLRGYTIATAESCTGGLLAAALTEVDGASKILEYSVVLYSERMKMRWGVHPATLKLHSVYSAEVALEMAEGAQSTAHSWIGVGITGVAGPGNELSGTVYIAALLGSRPGSPGHVKKLKLELGDVGRAQVRRAAVAHALRVVQALLHDAAAVAPTSP